MTDLENDTPNVLSPTGPPWSSTSVRCFFLGLTYGYPAAPTSADVPPAQTLPKWLQSVSVQMSPHLLWRQCMHDN
eukprot:COSAG06_NODE_25602_length_633_cov_0.670412_1_plen_74_part_01